MRRLVVMCLATATAATAFAMGLSLDSSAGATPRPLVGTGTSLLRGGAFPIVLSPGLPLASQICYLWAGERVRVLVLVRTRAGSARATSVPTSIVTP